MELRISLLNFNFAMIYIIHKTLSLIKNHLNYLKDNIFESFFKKYNRLFFSKVFFFIIYNDGKSEEEKITEDIRNIFRLKKEIKEFKDIVLRNFRNLFEYKKDEKNYYKPVRGNNFRSNNYIEYKSKGDKNKIISVEEYLNKIRPSLKGIINNLKKSDTWKTQLKQKL